VDLDSLGKIIERVASREGLELVHWEAVGPRNNFVLRIYIDKPGGVSHGDCEKVSTQVSTLLDVEDLIPHRFTLEVSSPGIERGLYKIADYERFAGSRIKLKTLEPINGQRNFKGRLEGVEDGAVILQPDTGDQLRVPYNKVAKANIEFEF
jgi:ribosome maturation factor RimP